MAEIRKHRPKTSDIGDLVRSAVDPGPRPVTPGEDSAEDPFFVEPEHEETVTPSPADIIDPGFSWVSVKPCS